MWLLVYRLEPPDITGPMLNSIIVAVVATVIATTEVNVLGTISFVVAAVVIGLHIWSRRSRYSRGRPAT